jgi:dTDP-4-amino-4,6-dideoxygalactose transaminase
MKKSPSKFGKGVGLLWRGMSLKIVSQFLLNTVKHRKLERIKDNDNVLLFESSRSALFNCLMSQNIGKGDEVVISSFTCDAVTYAVMRTGATVVYSDINDDLTMQTESVLRAITKSTKAIVMQNTLGRVGLDVSTISIIKKKNILLIEDCALSYGSVFDGIKLGAYGDFSFFSLEVSKTLTIGWGGVLSINNFRYKTDMLKRYASVGSVSLIQDTRRFFQLYLSLFLIKMKPLGGVWLWYFLYGFRIFRRSNSYDLNANCESEKMGNLSKSFYKYVHSQFDEFYRITNRNYLSFSSAAHKLGLEQTIVEKPSEFIVSPRFSLTLTPKNVELAVALGEGMNIEVGRWFSDSPPSWEVKDARVESSVNASRISDSIINLPCHWTLSKNEISKIKIFLYELSLIER